jgi:hypothetical protein
MFRSFLIASSFVCAAAQAQTHAPYAPFTAKQAELGKELAAKSLEVRKQITNGTGPAEPFKIMGNLYFVGNANGEVFLLTSPQGHIMMGAGSANSTEAVQKNIESMGFKMTDIKAILLNHNHGDQSGGAAYMKEKTGAPVMAGFGEVLFIEHGMFNPPAIPAPPPAADASVRHTFETFRKLYPVDIYLELGAYAWGGTLNQPSGTITERMAKLKTDNKLFVNREIFNQFSAAREVEFEEKMAAASRR